MISIITDSDSSLPRKLARKYNIKQVPITIQFGEDVYKTDVEINDEQVFARIDKEGKLPTTAAPSPGSFADAYREIFEKEKADAIICFCVSSEISATYSAAKLAAEEFEAKKRIEVVDTRSLTMGQGYMAIVAAETAQAGATVEKIIETAHALRERTHVYGALATLKYLSMSGRVSHLAAGMAGMLNIKPILAVQNGKLDLIEKVRTRKKAWARVIELVKRDVGSSHIERLCFLHVTAEEDAQEFKQLLQKSVECPKETPFVPLTPGLSVHTGAGLVGLAFVVA
ncbi:MAG TPA: DegV family protein [Anaerolineaceae bacterium]|nr:DegV family protein [Anaerolineaceae bacterium]